MTPPSVNNKNKYSDTEQALSDVSRLVSKLCNSRKAGMRLQEIKDLTAEVARLTRALQRQGTGHGDGQKNNGYGDPNHYAKISVQTDQRGITR